MSRKIEATFHIIIDDDFEDTVRKDLGYSSEVEIDNEDIKEFLEYSMDLPTSNDDAFKIEGVDTDGWFIQSVRMEE